jgi:guanylate kinase
MKNKAIIVSAPSGAGKTTIVRRLMAALPILEFSVSACSRLKRENETDGIDYYFISPEAFRKKIEADEFVEWQEVYPENYYGTLKSELMRIWKEGKIPVFDVDVIGGLNLKKYFGEDALSIFIQPPSVETLEYRLRNRGTESEESLRKRIGKSMQELGYSDRFDRTVVNDALDRSSNEAIRIVEEFLGHQKS